MGFLFIYLYKSEPLWNGVPAINFLSGISMAMGGMTYYVTKSITDTNGSALPIKMEHFLKHHGKNQIMTKGFLYINKKHVYSL